MRKDKKKKENVLLVQIGVRIVIFFAVIVALLSIVIYRGSTALFLRGKNDLMNRDLVRTRDELWNHPALTVVMDSWIEHPEYLNQEISNEKINDGLNKIMELEENGHLITADDYEKLPEIEKMMLARFAYLNVSGNLVYESSNFDYSEIYIMNITDAHRGLIVCKGEEANSYDEDVKIDTDFYTKDIDLRDHPALRRLISGDHDETEYEVFEGADEISKYIGYIPIYDEKMNSHYVVCIEYDWSVFKKGLVENLLIMAAVCFAIMLGAGAVLIFDLRRAAVNPVVKIQKSVREYISTKKSAPVVETMKTITAKNEFGMLAEDVSQLALEMDHYTAELRDSREAIKKLTDQVMEALAHTIDAKDKYTNGHSERVAIYSRMLAYRLGLSQEDQDKIYYMGLLHDIGKIGIPKEIINKDTKLSDEEYQLIQSHSLKGFDILKDIKSMPDLALGARWHHEKFDGSGYPDKKTGEEIPLLVRIIAVADTYDAMTSNRSYRQYLPQEVAREELLKNSGKQFDPAVAECMIKIIDEDKNYSLHE